MRNCSLARSVAHGRVTLSPAGAGLLRRGLSPYQHQPFGGHLEFHGTLLDRGSLVRCLNARETASSPRMSAAPAPTNASLTKVRCSSMRLPSRQQIWQSEVEASFVERLNELKPESISQRVIAARDRQSLPKI
jgi:hypothetical protein